MPIATLYIMQEQLNKFVQCVYSVHFSVYFDRVKKLVRHVILFWLSLITKLAPHSTLIDVAKYVADLSLHGRVQVQLHVILVQHFFNIEKFIVINI